MIFLKFVIIIIIFVQVLLMHVNTITSVLEAGPTVLIMFMCHAISFVVDHISNSTFTCVQVRMTCSQSVMYGCNKQVAQNHCMLLKQQSGLTNPL